MSWPTIDELVTGRIERSYLRRDGWWAELVLDTFAFLEPLGYSLTGSDMAGIHFHQKGNYIWFHGPGRDLAVEYDPESRLIDAALWDGAAQTALDQAILSLEPNADVPMLKPLDQRAVQATVRWWAGHLERNADELLGLGRGRVT